MHEFFDPAYTLDYADRATRSRIRSAQVGSEMQVKVHVTGTTLSATATGTRTADGSFEVRLVLDDRFQTFSLPYDDACAFTYER